LDRQSSKNKQASRRSSKKRQEQPEVPALFCSDPEKNFSLWAQSCFPDTDLAREDAIRQWLTTSLDFRLQKDRIHQAERVKSNAAQQPVVPPQEAQNLVDSGKTVVPTLTDGVTWTSKASAPSAQNGLFADRNLSRSLIKIGTVVVVGLVIGVALRIAPMGKGISEAAASIEANRTSNAGDIQAPVVVAPTDSKSIETESYRGATPNGITTPRLENSGATQPGARSSIQDDIGASDRIMPRPDSGTSKSTGAEHLTAPRKVAIGTSSKPTAARTAQVNSTQTTTEPGKGLFEVPVLDSLPASANSVSAEVQTERQPDVRTALPDAYSPGSIESAAGSGNSLEPAKLVSSPAPIYPKVALLMNLRGTVLIDAAVDETGRVTDIQVISGNPVFRSAAMEAIQNWKYEPARLNGQPTATHVQVKINFDPQ
jgi:TonB family protein